jgi:hypothetical protein
MHAVLMFRVQRAYNGPAHRVNIAPAAAFAFMFSDKSILLLTNVAPHRSSVMSFGSPET